MQSRQLRSGAVVRWTLAGIALVLGPAAGAQDFSAYQRAEQNSRRLEANTKANIERIHAETRQSLSAQGSARWRADGPDFSSYGAGTDNAYAPSSLAARPLSRSAPPPAGAEWIAKAQEAWRAGRDSDAAEHLRRASEAGSAVATRVLGSAYAEGVGVPKNDGTALALYRQAATMGDTEALLHLGRAYALGRGTPVDLREALDWYTKASRRSSTREQGERGVAAVRELARLEVQLAALERCEKTGVCEQEPSSGEAAGAAAPPAAQGMAASWSKLPIAGGVADFYVDRASLSRRDDVVVVSELMDYRAPQTLASNASYQSATMRKEYDCRHGTVRILSAQA